MVYHFCHNYSTRSLLLLLSRFERNILFHATLYYVFTIYIHSMYILFFSPFDPNSIDREFDRFYGSSLLPQLFHSIIIIIVIIITIATFRTKYPFPCFFVLRVHDLYPLYIHTFLLFVRSQFNRQGIRRLLKIENIVIAFVVHHFCHNYSTRSLLLLLLLSRFERNILFHATWSYAFTIRILSPYPLDTRRVSTRGGRGWGGEKGHGKVVKPLSRGVYGAEMLLASISSPLLRGGGCIMRAGERVL